MADRLRDVNGPQLTANEEMGPLSHGHRAEFHSHRMSWEEDPGRWASDFLEALTAAW